MSEWFQINQLGSVGIEPGQMPQCRAPQSLDMAVNCRAVGQEIANAGGYTVVPNGTTLNSPTTLFYARDIGTRLLLLPGNTQVYEFDGTTMVDRTGADPTDGIGRRWHGGWLAGGLFLANEKAVRTFRPGIDLTTIPAVYDEITGDTWETLNYRARVTRPFKNFMLAANIWEDTDYFPTLVRWSNAVQPGEVPVDWVPRASNLAGAYELADTEGSVVDMVPLRDALIVYKRDSIHICEFTEATIGGTAAVFRFRRAATNRGLFARDCVVEYNGLHFVQGIEDIYTFDGNTPNSIVYGKIKKFWLADRDPSRAINNWTALDQVREEVLFGYVSQDAPGGVQFPNKVLALNLKNGSWWPRDYAVEVPHVKSMLEIKSTPATSNWELYGIDEDNSRLLTLESSPHRDGANVPAYFERTALMTQPGADWIQVDEAQLHITGATAQLKLGGQTANDAPVNYRDQFAYDPEVDYHRNVRQNNNLIAFRVDISADTEWRVCSLNLLVQKSGERG